MSQAGTVLMLVDLQQEYFTDGRPLRVFDGGQVLGNAGRLLAAARAAGVPVIHVRHESADASGGTFAPGSPYLEFAPAAAPVKGEAVVTKRFPGAFTGTGLMTLLKELGAETIVLCGLMSFMCCDTTAREAYARGFKVLFVRDATAAVHLGYIPAETVHAVTLAVQSSLFSRVVSADQAEAVLNGASRAVGI